MQIKNQHSHELGWINYYLFHAFLRNVVQVLQLGCSHTGMKDCAFS